MPEATSDRRPSFRLGAVIMAAGGSSRMGSVKQLLVLDGSPLIVRAVDATLGSTARPVVVVLGANAGQIREAIARHSVTVAINPDWSAGLASTIRTGLIALFEADPRLDAVLLAPCDQPALSSDIISRLASLHQATGSIAAARFNGRNGAPAIFGRRNFPQLLALSGDEGARTLLNSGVEAVVPLDLPEMSFDIDTPEDARAWAARSP
jgi:molybdenum cofactor cytidylyltransferase